MGVPQVKEAVREYAEREFKGVSSFRRIEIEGKYAFVGADIQHSGILSGWGRYALVYYQPEESIIAEENVRELGSNSIEKLNSRIDEWLHMSEQELRSNF